MFPGQGNRTLSEDPFFLSLCAVNKPIDHTIESSRCRICKERSSRSDISNNRRRVTRWQECEGNERKHNENGDQQQEQRRRRKRWQNQRHYQQDHREKCQKLQRSTAEYIYHGKYRRLCLECFFILKSSASYLKSQKSFQSSKFWHWSRPHQGIHSLYFWNSNPNPAVSTCDGLSWPRGNRNRNKNHKQETETTESEEGIAYYVPFRSFLHLLEYVTDLWTWSVHRSSRNEVEAPAVSQVERA